MIKLDKVDKVPSTIMPFIEQAGHVCRPGLLRSFLAMSYDNAYCTEDGKPLFLIGAFKLNLLSPRAELWLCTTDQLKSRHIRPLRKLMKEWLDRQTVKIIVRCALPKHAKFVSLIGFKFKEHDGSMMVFEANNG